MAEEFYTMDGMSADDSGYMSLDMDWDGLFDDNVGQTDPEKPIPAADAFVRYVAMTGGDYVDIAQIAAQSGETIEGVTEKLRGTIYRDPAGWDGRPETGWQVSWVYLSGNIRQKLSIAKRSEERFPGMFSDNIKALEALVPADVSSEDIYITLGSPWVPADIISAFIKDILGISGRSSIIVSHDSYSGTWEIKNKNLYNMSVAATNQFGTMRIPALELLEMTLNMKAAEVKNEVICYTNKSGRKLVTDYEETVLALEKQRKMTEYFRKWVWKDKDRKKRLMRIFETTYGSISRRSYCGDFLSFPGVSPEYQLYGYQKNAAARIMLSPNTLLALDVGSGKTVIMIAAGMELKRMGLSSKNLYVVPNHLVGQWETMFREVYPGANVLAVDSKTFTPEKRQATLEKIRDCDYDGIIMAYSCFERIPLSLDFYIADLEQQLEDMHDTAAKIGRMTGSLKRRITATVKKLTELRDTVYYQSHSREWEHLSKLIFFDQLGITRLFVDEAHNYKNVPVSTKVNMSLGISAGGSKKCEDMLNKVHFVQRSNNGGGVVMATATPITNSITDAYVMQNYLQSGELELLDLKSFDSWIGMFAERHTGFEVDVDTQSYRLASRFSRFHNLPELTAMLSSFAEFHQSVTSDELPEFNGYEDVLIPRTAEFKEYLDDISRRADEIRHGHVPRHEDNLLKITTDGRKAALDIRLVRKDVDFTELSKAAQCARRAAELYFRTADEKYTQIIFCDSSTPKQGFNLYDEIKRLLIEYGVDENEIAFIHDCKTESARKKLFARVRDGSIRILFGSTAKLGLGVNIQDRLVGIHHTDVPWRPADMTQREGRIIRPGNTCSEIYIYRYITEGSFDAYSWQLLETKQRFICDLLSGTVTERSGSDIDEIVLKYAEVMALAVGNELVKKRIETANQISRYTVLQQRFVENRLHVGKQLDKMPERLKKSERVIEKCRRDMEHYASQKREHEAEERRMLGELIIDKVVNKKPASPDELIGEYQGFSLILPETMTKERPFIWVSGTGRYYLELSDGKSPLSKIGVIMRLDNLLEGLGTRLERLNGEHEKLKNDERTLRTELEKKDGYTDLIENAKKELAEIDKKLGVNTDG